MTTRLVSTTIDDRPGQLGRIARCLADGSVNIEAFGAEAGRVTFLTNDPDRAASCLQEAGYRPHLAECFEVHLPNQPGQLATLGETLGKANVNILSSFGSAKDGRIYLRVDNATAARPVLERFAPARVQSGRTAAR